MDREFEFSIGIRLLLLVAATICFAAALLGPASANATPATQFGTSSLAGQLALDGGVLYATNGRVVSRTDISNGTSRIVVVAPRGYLVDYVVAGGGVVGVQLSKTVKRSQVATRAVAYTDATNSTRILAKGAMSAKRKLLCGTEAIVTDVTESGEAITARNSYALSKKRCRKPVSTSSIVRGHSAAGVRVLYSGRSNTSRSFASLGGLIFGAELAGNKLTLNGTGVGVFDLASQQFILVRAAGRKTIFVGRTDKNANTLVVGIPLRASQVKYELIDAASGYGAATPIETTNQPVRYEACGDYLVRSLFAAKRGSANTITILANPLIPAAAPNPDQLVPSGEYLIDSACDANGVAFSTIGSSTKSANLWRAPLSG